MLKKYIKISMDGYGGYIVEPSELQEALKNELGDLGDVETGTVFHVEIIEMDEKDFDNLEEFTGW